MKKTSITAFRSQSIDRIPSIENDRIRSPAYDVCTVPTFFRTRCPSVSSLVCLRIPPTSNIRSTFNKSNLCVPMFRSVSRLPRALPTIANHTAKRYFCASNSIMSRVQGTESFSVSTVALYHWGDLMLIVGLCLTTLLPCECSVPSLSDDHRHVSGL